MEMYLAAAAPVMRRYLNWANRDMVMRDPERIPEMLELLGKVWEIVPDQRLGQLIVNLTRYSDGSLRDPWIVEDDMLEAKLRELVDFHNL